MPFFKLALLLPRFVLASAQWTRGEFHRAKMSFKFPLLMMLLQCLDVVNAQNYICGRNGGVPCWKREQPEQGAIIEDTPKKFIQPLEKLSNKRRRGFAQIQEKLYGKSGE